MVDRSPAREAKQSSGAAETGSGPDLISARPYEAAVEVLPVGVAMYDADRRLMFTNPAFRTLYGLSEAHLRPGTSSNLILKAISAPQAHIRGKAIGEASFSPRLLASARNERVRVSIKTLPEGGWLEVHTLERESPLTGPAVTLVTEDVQPAAVHEGVGVSRLLDLISEALSTTSVDLGASIALHFIKIDGFEDAILDYGKTSADMILSLADKRIKSSIRSGDVVAEVSKDTFVVLQTGVDVSETAHALTLRLLKGLSAPYRIASTLIPMTVRCGLAFGPTDARDAANLYENARTAAESIPRGTIGYQLFSKLHKVRAFSRDAISRELPNAIESGALTIHYQPIIDIHKLEVAGFEALMRWQHPEHGLIYTPDFISVAEETEQIALLSTWAVETACRDAAMWEKPYTVSVNFSGSQFGKTNTAATVWRALKASGLDPKRLIIEITETAILGNEEAVHQQLSELQGFGVQVALDDFGLAYATLANLRDFRFNKIKVDRSFVGEVPDRKNCAAIVKAVAGLADALEIRSVAEGVETLDQLKQVREFGYSEIQGFYFSTAVPADQVAQSVIDCETKLVWLRD